MSDMLDYLQTAIYAARHAGNYMREAQKRPLTVINKGYRDWVTDVDLTCQKMIVETIRQDFPDHHFMAEEGDLARANWDINGPPLWIIDPLDGTSNYSRGLSNFAVSIALAVNGFVQVGVVFDPTHDEMFTAVAGQGSRCNGNRLHVNGAIHQLQEAVLALDWGRSDAQRRQTMASLQNVVHHVRTIRAIGSAALALCWLADGRLDAYLNYNMKTWDIAAGGLIVCEAGGRVSDPQGTAWNIQNQQSWSISTVPEIQDELLGLI